MYANIGIICYNRAFNCCFLVRFLLIDAFFLQLEHSFSSFFINWRVIFDEMNLLRIKEPENESPFALYLHHL